MSDGADRRRRSFGPVVLAGLAAAGLTALGGSRDWASAPATGPTTGPTTGLSAGLAFGDTGARVPLAAALSLVVLAAWGVLLVTRRRVRRATAVLACLAATGVVATVLFGYGPAADGLTQRMSEGLTDGAVGPVARTGWYWASLVASAVSALATAVAVRLVPYWPEMGSRYDAPGAGRGGSGSGSLADATGLDLWRALDEGRDPTLTDRPPTEP
jgi:uncharacterized membrane protein (TIGR02234 family)